ncbi:hypothetical protein LCGC14_2536940 [marine sediment metagenome]|uniref:HNH nuclease domain-containing protein n=1 Tax=marine sediment metagenome TaxID=412755 RepID=A0A0F9ASB2_9ZZZZ
MLSKLFQAKTSCSNTPKLIELRFLAKIREAENGCWLWIGAITRVGGYGHMGVCGKCIKAHHVSWLLYRGPLPEDPDIWVLHTCDTPSCVNPDHLFLGTHTDNIRDASQKGRISRTHQLSGENHGKTKLTMIQVEEIRDAEGLFLQRELAEQYEVSRATIGGVLRREVYV